MTQFVITIIGISAISILIDILLPEGQTNKYIKGIFSVITLLVIVSSLINLFDKNININDLLQVDSELNADQETLKEIMEDKYKIMEEDTERILEMNNYKNIEIYIYYDISNPNVIKKVVIDIQNYVIENENTHINNIKSIKQIVKLRTNVNEEIIEIYDG
jgi:stage III sporulation protein AF